MKITAFPELFFFSRTRRALMRTSNGPSRRKQVMVRGLEATGLIQNPFCPMPSLSGPSGSLRVSCLSMHLLEFPRSKLPIGWHVRHTDLHRVRESLLGITDMDTCNVHSGNGGP
jgi:hypothetical protein